MGCDIHMYCEIKKDGEWKYSGPIFDDKYFNKDKEINEYNQPKTAQPYSGRNYNLFGMLANVRNGYGFAGCDTGDGYEPISKPKGLPEDVSEDIRLISDNWGMDGHSHSYLTVKELLEYNWDQTTKTRGFVNPKSYKDFKENGNLPRVWCGGTNQPDWKQIEWDTCYKEDAGSFYNETLPLLQTLGNPEDVRIVFWFDN